MNVLVTGANGQLGKCLHSLKEAFSNLNLFFFDSFQLDITDKKSIEKIFNTSSYDYVINCAAYTNVEQAEKEPEKAFLVNAKGVKNLAETCEEEGAVLIHISTDYVFDGNKNTPYTEKDVPNPINEYGRSKLKGEEYIQEILEKHMIIRTSWLYSQFGKNFYKTIIDKSKIQNKFTITTSEIGTPTNANDLAFFLFQVIKTSSKKYGIYHFSNLGRATWYDFAEEILEVSGKLSHIKLEKTDNYPTFAKRPSYSVLSKEKVIKEFDLEIFKWDESLRKLMKQ